VTERISSIFLGALAGGVSSIGVFLFADLQVPDALSSVQGQGSYQNHTLQIPAQNDQLEPWSSAVDFTASTEDKGDVSQLIESSKAPAAQPAVIDVLALDPYEEVHAPAEQPVLIGSLTTPEP